MLNAKIAGLGFYVPEKVITNHDLSKIMDTSDEWIQERTGIKERRHAIKCKETTTTMGAKASKIAIERAGIGASDVDFIIFATLSPDYYFPGCGVLLQRALGINNVGALDVRNQCSGFVYALSVAEQYIKSGMYKNILVVGSEFHSAGMDFSTKGRDVSVIFGDGAGAAVIQSTTETGKGILSTHLHADGRHAEQLAVYSPGVHGGKFLDRADDTTYEHEEFGSIVSTPSVIASNDVYPYMNGRYVFKYAVQKFPEVVVEALSNNGFELKDLDLLIPHQANLRISQFVQKKLQLRDDQVFNNIQKYGNTTAASIPIALCEAWENGKVNDGDLVCLAAFGSGFTWASALIRW